MNDTSRRQGWAITIGAVFLGLLFLAGLLNGSYLALAVPVGVLTFFVLGLVAWVGHTIATVEVEAEPTVIGEPEAVIEEPEAVVEEPEAVIEEPEAVIEEPEAVVEPKAPERAVERDTAPEGAAD